MKSSQNPTTPTHDNDNTYKEHHTDIQMRFNDTDAYQHVNNTSFALYAEQARLDFLVTLGEHNATVILARICLDFLAQVRYGQQVYVKTSVVRVGNTSATLQQHIYVRNNDVRNDTAAGDPSKSEGTAKDTTTKGTSDTLAAKVESVVVYFDYDSQKPATIPANIREGLEPYTHPNS